MLRLKRETAPDWAARAAAGVEDVLVDHAHLEKKAAATAIELMFRYPDRPELHLPLSELAREELTHFEAVRGILDRRGIRFQRVLANPYMERLKAAIRRGEPDRLVDSLLACALIEARSCERMQRLAEALSDAELAEFYRGLLASEARHHQLYVDLACTVVAEDVVYTRLEELSAHEASILTDLPRAPRLHGG